MEPTDTEGIPPREIQYFSDKTAMLDMAAAFGQGVRGVEGGDTITWSLDALLDGRNFLAVRLAKKKKDYWTVREEALRVSRLVGEWAASAARADGHVDADNFVVIERKHMQGALAKLGPGAGASGTDCPF